MNLLAQQPLRDVSVVEHATFVAGPSAGMTLAQLGADVIRVDPPGGGPDAARWPVDAEGRSIYWASLNKGKRSVALDHRRAEGRELLGALVTASGTYVDNLPDRSRLTYEELRLLREDVIHVHLQGHADGRPAVDYTVNASVGAAAMTGPASWSRPVNHVVPAWDLLAGGLTAVAVLSAVHARRLHATGAQIDLALEDVALGSLGSLGWLAEAAMTGASRPPVGNDVYGTYGADFETSDGRRVMVMALTPAHWRGLCAVTGTGEAFAALQAVWAVDLSHEGERFRHREQISAVLRPWFAARPFVEVERRLNEGRVVWGPFATLAEVATAAPTISPHLVRVVDQPGLGPVLATSSPLQWDAVSDIPGAAPRIGQHSEEVLCQMLGLSEAEVGALVGRGVVATG